MSSLTEKLAQAVKEAKNSSRDKKFDQSVDLIVTLRDIDVKKPENKIDDIVELPNPPGREAKVCVFASGSLAIQAKQSNADLVLDREGIEKLATNRRAVKKLARDYDFFLGEGALIQLVGKLMGFALGPRGKMPRPIPPGTSIDALLAKYRKSVRVRARDQPVIQCKVGNSKMPNEEIVKNIESVLDRIKSRLEKGMKNVRDIRIKTTMGKSIRVDVS